MKKARLTTSFLCVSIGALLLSCQQSRRSKTVLSPGASLSDKWLILNTPFEFHTVGPVSEIFIAITGNSTVSADKGVTLENGKELQLEGYLTTSNEKRINLGQTWCRVNSQTYVILESPVLEWKDQAYRFRALSLRSNIPINTGKIIWLSDDPRNNKAGVIIP